MKEINSFAAADEVNREIHEPRKRKFKYAEGVTAISPVLADAIGLRRENVPQDNSPSPRRTRRGPG
jgi:hypothetical protein